MKGIVKVSVLLLLVTSKGNAFSNILEQPEDNALKEFIVEHNKETRELIKIEMEAFFDMLSESFKQELTAIRAELKNSHDNLSKLCKEEQATSVSKMQSQLGNLSELLTRQMTSGDLKVAGTLEKLQESFSRKLETSETKILSEFGSQFESTRRNCTAASQVDGSLSVANPYQFTNQSISTPGPAIQNELSNQTDIIYPTQTFTMLQEPLNRVELEEISADTGTIEFNRRENSHLQRKIWVFRTKQATYFTSTGTKFVMEENNLGGNAFLTLWDNNGEVVKHVWNGSQTDWGRDVSSGEHLILLTLTKTPSVTPVPLPSFKLSFIVTRESSGYVHSGEVVSKNIVSLVSYPPQNTQNYPPKGAFHLVVAPSSGRTFKLTLKYLDVPGTPPGCSDNSLKVYFLEENSTGGNYKPLNTSAYRVCGRLGNVSELIGTTTVAIVQFHSHTSNVGRGIRLEVDTN